MSEALEAGPALDVRIAKQVMGWTFEPFELDIRDWRAPDRTLHADVPPYSTDIAAAWQVVEALAARPIAWGLSLSGHPADEWEASFYPRAGQVWGAAPYSLKVHAPTVPLAICRAALAAVTNEAAP